MNPCTSRTLSRLAAGLSFAIALTCTPASAQDKTASNRPGKAASCATQAEGKKGDERKAFLSQCKSVRKGTQQEKMAMCSKDATGKKGDERRSFMSTCLKAPMPG